MHTTTIRAILCAAALLASASATTAQDLSSLTDADVEYGRRMYVAQCARCHGVEGAGGEGPVLARPFLNYARDDETLVSVIRNGIPGTAMGGGWWISDLESRQIAAFVRSLGRTVRAEATRGDATLGRTLFLGKGACDACHGPTAAGNRFGPDLTSVGLRRSQDFIRESIVTPGAALPRGTMGTMETSFSEYLPVRAVVVAGAPGVRGYRVNETSFAILVRDRDGALHSFDKTELEALTKQFGRSLMPSYRTRLTDGEVDDLVAYLISLREVIP